MRKEINVQKLFDLLLQIEIKMAQVYECFSKKFADNTDAKNLFLRLQQDEISHQTKVKFEKNLAFKSKSSLKSNLKEVEFDEIHSLLTMMEEIISSTDTISLEEALAGAMDFEENACQRHHKIATELFDEPTAKLIKSLGKADDEHFNAVKKFIKDNKIKIIKK